MTFWVFLKFLWKFLPEIYSLLKGIHAMIERGIEEKILRDKITKIGNAFANPNRAEAARQLNDVFRT
jgi:hypothetical protein